MSANNPTFTLQVPNQPALTAGFTTEYLNSRVARITLSVSVNNQQPVQRILEMEVGQEFPVGLEFLRGTLIMSQQAVINFTGGIETPAGQFLINNAIIAVNS
jgi:hypothetical protein